MTDLPEQTNENYNIRNNNSFFLLAVRTAYHDSQSISISGPKIWIILPDVIKNAQRLGVFKTKIKSWKSENCGEYVQNLDI